MTNYPDGVEIRGPVTPEFAEILTPEALAFVARLAREFDSRRRELLQKRVEQQAKLDAGQQFDFLPETASIRADTSWSGPSIPADIQDRRTEITGPCDRKMVVNALNSGAKVFMSDLEDANTPNWHNNIQGQINLRDAINRQIDFTSAEGKEYKLNDQTAVLFLRPRGWHLEEKHLLVDGRPVSGGIMDFGLYFFHNARNLLAKGSGPYFYLPKLEHYLEARLWNDIFVLAQQELGVPQGTIRATVLIETLPAAFQQEEIIYELREHSAGLNCGRWDYIFSCIKKFRNDSNFVLADRALVTMTTHFMRSYSLLSIQTCHRRNVHAMGGMAAQIPIKDDPEANEQALAKVLADKEREASDGHDGTWVAHPGLVHVALQAFDKHMPNPNQIERKREDVSLAAKDLLTFEPEGPITEKGLRLNINVGIQYIGAWLAGSGAVPIYNLMEDAATAEISRAQVWQWIRSPLGKLDDGRKVTKEMVHQMIPEEIEKIKEYRGETYSLGRYEEAAQIFEHVATSDEFIEFLTLPAYERID